MQAMAVAAAMEIAKKAGGGLLKKVGTKAQGCNYEVVVDFEISNFTESEMYVIGSSTSDGCMVVQPINVPAKGLMEFKNKLVGLRLEGMFHTWYGNQKEGDQTCIVYHGGILLSGAVPDHNHATIKVQISEPNKFNVQIPMKTITQDPELEENFFIKELGL